MGFLQSYSDEWKLLQNLLRLQHSVLNVLSENMPISFHVSCPALRNLLIDLFSVSVLEMLISTSSDFSSTRVAETMSLLCSDLHAHVLEVETNNFWAYQSSQVNVRQVNGQLRGHFFQSIINTPLSHVFVSLCTFACLLAIPLRFFDTVITESLSFTSSFFQLVNYFCKFFKLSLLLCRNQT